MQLIPNIALQERLLRSTKYIVSIVILIGILVLIGWQFDIDILKHMIPGLAAMNPVTASCFILISISFLLKKYGSGIQLLLGNLFALIVCSFAVLKIGDLIYNFDLKPDMLLYPEKIKVTFIYGRPNYMAPNTAVCLVLSALSLFLLNVETKAKRMPVQFIALLIAFIGLLSVLGYIYQVKSFYEVPLFIPMAINTALCFFLTAIAFLFAHPGKGIMKQFTSIFTGSVTAQLLVPAAIILPGVLGFLRLYGDWIGLYSKEFGVALFALSVIIVFLVLIWYNTVQLNKRDLLKKQIEDALQKSREEIVYIAGLIDKTSDGIISFDRFFNIMTWNKGAEKIYGYTLEEVKGKPSRFIFRNDYPKQQLDEWVRQLKEKGYWNGELKQLNKNNLPVYCLLSTAVLKNEQGEINGFLTVAKDVTERRKEEDKLKKSEERFRLLVNNAKEYAIFMLNTKGEVISWNNGAALIHGYTENEIIGKPMDVFYLEEDRLKGEPASNLAATKKEGQYETEAMRVRKDGSCFLANVIFTALYNENGELSGYSKIIRDITKSKQLEQDLRRSNAEMEAFTYSVSHDLRAPLRSIIGFTTILAEDHAAKLDDEAKRLMGIITKNTGRMGKLIDDLLAFSKMSKQDIIKTDFDTNEMVNAVIAEQNNKDIQNNIRWMIDDLPPMHADINSMKQVWINLISNAIKYSAKQEKPQITIGTEKQQAAIIFYIKDNGVGFDTNYSNKLFKVFQRLHSSSEFEGTGVGLAIVEKIISKHGGEIWAEAEVNKGATFYFSIPGKNNQEQITYKNVANES
ncbi:MAG: PAS domain S-box protein [Ferruginibacter sp.]